MKKKHWIGFGALSLGAGVGAARFLLPPIIESRLNRTQAHDPYRVSPEARALHASIPATDLHSDALLWNRNLNRRGNRGHVDFPRLREGGVALQVFSSVTHGPRDQEQVAKPDDFDLLTALAIAQSWPPRTWNSFFERAMYQGRKLQRFEAQSRGGVQWIRSGSDLRDVLAARAAGEETVGAVFGIEGGQALEGDLSKLDRLYDAGLRVLGLFHFIDNELGGSLHGTTGAGLTEFGQAVVRGANEKSMVIDVAHASPAAVRDVLSISNSPIILSHGGLKAMCDSPRNLEDDLMVEIASRGGLVGIGFWEAAACDITPEGVVRSIRHAVDLLGPDHVALGSDYDGTVEVAFDASELPVLTQTMMDEGFTEEEIRKVMGQNAVTFFLERLPSQEGGGG